MTLKNILFFILLVILTLAGCSNKPGKYDAFAQCLTEKGIVMYGTDWCSHCQNQKKEFGKSFQYINYVNCDFQKSECDKASIRGYPTWNINGTNYPGEQSLYRLRFLSGCDL